MVGQVQAPTVAWDPKPATGIEPLNTQHQALFDCMNMLETAIQGRRTILDVYVLDQLASYAHNHFADEKYLARWQRLVDFLCVRHNVSQMSMHAKQEPREEAGAVLRN